MLQKNDGIAEAISRNDKKCLTLFKKITIALR